MGAGPVLLPQLDELERNWAIAEHGAARCMGVINGMTAELCEVLGELHRNEAWMGGGIRSLEHWATWKAGVAKHRAGNLVQVARRITELLERDGAHRAHGEEAQRTGFGWGGVAPLRWPAYGIPLP